jgi:hypothetical protein
MNRRKRFMIKGCTTPYPAFTLKQEICATIALGCQAGS